MLLKALLKYKIFWQFLPKSVQLMFNVYFLPNYPVENVMPVALGSTVRPGTRSKDLTSRCASMYTKFIQWECKKYVKVFCISMQYQDMNLKSGYSIRVATDWIQISNISFKETYQVHALLQ
jgi:hypothetical protein